MGWYRFKNTRERKDSTTHIVKVCLRMVSKQPILTRLIHGLPGFVQRGIYAIIHRSDILLLFKFYWGEGNILRANGWFESERAGQAVTADGNPLPWYTYPAIEFLNSRLVEDFRVFEFGGGGSTHWYADRVGTVIAVDDSPEWTRRVRELLPANGEIVLRTEANEYYREPLDREPFDLVAVDASFGTSPRTESLDAADAVVSDTGVILWDDYDALSDEDIDEIRGMGYSILPFRGLKALTATDRTTAIFYPDNNVLGI